MVKLPDIEWLNNLRIMLGEYQLARSPRVARSVQSIGLGQAKSVGIIMSGSDEVHFKAVRELVDELKGKGQRSVRAIGYVRDAKLAESLASSSFIDFFSNADLDLQFRPDNPKVALFIKEQFDVLIDLQMTHRYPLLHVAAQSNAKFKVARRQDGLEAHFDLMIEADAESDIRQFIQHVLHYLKAFDQ